MLKHPLFLIIDGMSQAYRAYFAIRGLASTRASDQRRIRLRDHAQTRSRKVSRRTTSAWHSTVPSAPCGTPSTTSIKPRAKRMPSDLAQQMPYIRKFCEAMRIPVLEIPGQEADDIIATVTTRAVESGLYPVVVTLDKDLYQLVDTILILNTSKDDLIVDREKVQELFGVTPEQIPDLLGLWGDSSDNVPGAPGIGEKGARDLIQKFGSIENLPRARRTNSRT